MEFQVRYLALYLLFSVIDGFQWFSMGSLHHNIQLMLEFLKAPFLVLYFSYYTLMTFLMMLSMILLSMLMILLSILSVISIWSVATTWIGFWICIWSTRHFLHYLYCQKGLQENWTLNLFFEVSFSWGCSVSMNLPYAHEWNTVVVSGLVPLVATWNC